MKKGLFFVLAVLFSNQLIADEISGGSRINMQSGQLTIPCVEVDDPGSAFDQKFFDVRLKQSGDSFELFYVQEEDSEACKPLIEASLNADEDTSDVNGDLGGTAVPPVVYKIRDLGPAGGLVFYITDGGRHGLEAAPVDQRPPWGSEWGCMGTEISGADGIAVGTGAQNSDDMLTGCAAATSDFALAAHAAANYSLNGFNDWFLPSKDALNLMYINLIRYGLGDFERDGLWDSSYWSSSQVKSNLAWFQDFGFGIQGDGFQSPGNKDVDRLVRAVRAF